MVNIDRFVPSVISSSYSRKLFVLLFVVVIFISLIGVAIYTQTSSALQEETEQSLNQSTQLQAETLSEWTDRTTHHAQLLSEADAITSGESHERHSALLESESDAPSSVSGVYYVETDTYEILQGSDLDAVGTTLSDHDIRWIEQGLTFENTSDTQLTSPYTDPLTGQPSIAAISPVDGDPDHAVVLVIDLEAQSSSLMRPSQADGAHTYAVNSEGTVVLSHHTDDIALQNMGQEEYEPHSQPVIDGLEGETGYVEMEMDGHGHIDYSEMSMGYTLVEGTDWVIMTHIPTAEAYALQHDIENSVAALILVSLLGLGAIGVVIGRDTARSLDHLSEKANELERGNLATELSSNRDDEIGDLYGAFASMRDSLQETITEAEEAREHAEHRERELATLAKQLEEEASTVMARAADGDLTERMAVDGNDEDEAMAQVVREYNEMMAGIEATVEELKLFATDVAAHSEQMSASVEEVEAASEQVTTSVQEISSHTDRQYGTFRQVATEMNAIATMTDDVASLSRTVSDAAEQTANTGDHGRVAAREAKAAMARIDTESRETLEEIETLQSEMDRIEGMAEFIAEVATQTNVLALNANIEATRAKSETDGFSAVAGEVKALASETKDSAQEIETVVGEIQEQMGRTAGEVKRTREVIDESSTTIGEAGEALEEIAEHAETTHDGVQEIAALSHQQASSTQEVTEMVSEAATASDKVSEEAEAVAAAAQEQTSSLHEVSHSANDLAAEAHSLQFSLDQFETGVEDDGERDADENEDAETAPQLGNE